MTGRCRPGTGLFQLGGYPWWRLAQLGAIPGRGDPGTGGQGNGDRDLTSVGMPSASVTVRRFLVRVGIPSASETTPLRFDTVGRPSASDIGRALWMILEMPIVSAQADHLGQRPPVAGNRRKADCLGDGAAAS